MVKAADGSVAGALLFAQHQHANRSRNWTTDCQMFCRCDYGRGGGNATAYKQWLNTPASHKHVGGNPDDAPVGSLLCYKGENAAGHIMLAAYAFKNGTSAAWSNDLVRTGYIDKVSRHAPITAWDHKYLGYITQVNGYNIPIKTPKPAPKPAKPVVHLDDILAAFHADPPAKQGHKTHPKEVNIVENALKAEGLLSKSYAGDGSFGTTSITAYAKWQHKQGHKPANGKPDLGTLEALGHKHGFTVKEK